MNYKNYLLTGLVVLFLFSITSVFSQSLSPEKVVTPVGFDKSKKLTEVPIVPPGYRDRTWKNKTIQNKEGFLEEFNSPAEWTGPDPVLQNEISGDRSTATVGQNFAGVGNLAGVAPPDTDGDVGLNHYMQMVNMSFQIWDKNGNSLYGPADNSTLWDGFDGPWTGTNDGDPIVLYDEYSDRWIATQFSLPNYPNGPFYEMVAVSETGDPTGAWYRYAYEFTDMPDYPKFGVWNDGYYFTINQFASGNLSFAGAAVCVLDRDAMITGDPNAEMLFFNLGTSYGSLIPADADGPTQPGVGTPNYLMNMSTNLLRVWEADIDWTNTSNSSVTLVNSLSTQSFSYSGITINQPGTSQTLDALATRLMYRVQYRNFGSYEVMLTNHSANADGNGQAGVRWYELRNYGSGWSIYQQGTFAPADGDNRWMGSVAMNGNGDIGIGYSVSSSSTYPSIRFAGQTASNSGTGTLDVSEGSIKAGSNSQTGVNRWGDYSMMSIDPSDDQTFWYTTEYSGGGWSWLTQIASFSFEPPVVNAPVAAFSGSPISITEGQTVTFTDESTNTPTSWSWSFPGGNPATSTAKNPVITYLIPGTYNVSLTVSNSGGTDQLTKTAYIGVIPIELPVAAFSGNPTSITEGQTVSFTDQSSNNPTTWSWSFPGGTPESSSDQNPVVTYSTAGDYDVSLISSNTEGDSEILTKSAYINVTEFTVSYCASSGGNSSLEWIETFAIGSNTNNSGSNGGYGDFTGNLISVESGNSYNITMTPGFSSRARKEFWRVWIDYNMDGDFTDAGEQVFSADRQKGVVSGSINIPSGLTGQTRMRVSMKYNLAQTSCEQFAYGEVEDYTLLFGAPVPQPPVADFSGTPTTIDVGSSVNFSDLSSNDPLTWSWSFAGGTPSTSAVRNPAVNYDTEGIYEVSLTVTNNEGSDTKTVAGYITVTAGGGGGSYCESTSESNALDWIAQVDIASFSNSSGASFYSDFTGMIIGLAPGSSNSITLTPTFTGRDQREFWRVWIDYNSDGDFEDIGEEVFLANNKKSAVSGTISIPSDASGQTRMRITMKNGGSPTPCDIFSNGEVEDYTVDFGNGPASLVRGNDFDINVYPNPATNMLNVHLAGNNEMVNIKVYNAFGKILDELNVSGIDTQIDLSSYANGMYYIGADNGKHNTLKKFIKN